VNTISFEVYRNETLGIIGESGSGKSTLGRTIVKLIHASSGNIRYKGRYLADLHGSGLKQFRRQVQIIFQDPYSSLNPKQRIGEMLTEVLKVHDICRTSLERKARSYELLEQVKLDRYAFQKYPHEFSGGQRQRIGIARALAVQPEFIICDESVSGLDVSIQADILNLLNDLKEEYGLTYIFISHDLSVVRYMSDRILVFRDGSMVEEGFADEVFATPLSAYTKELLAAMVRQAEGFGAKFLQEKVLGVELEGATKQINTSRGIYPGKTVIIATGFTKDYAFGEKYISSLCEFCNVPFKVVSVGYRDESRIYIRWKVGSQDTPHQSLREGAL
jgi:peptide/nickel transport system ATP-binding protein